MAANSTILNLVAAMERAKCQRNTDEDEAWLAPRRAYTKDIEDLILKWHTDNGGPLDTYDCILGLAISLGLAIRTNADVHGSAGTLAVLVKMLQQVTDAAIGKIVE